MSLIRIVALSSDSAVQLDAENDRTYHLEGGQGDKSAITVDMERVGDRLIITLVRPAPKLDPSDIHRKPTPSLEEFDKKQRGRKR